MHIRTAVAAAYASGRDLDLSACAYGPSTGGLFRAEPMRYYYWLAGLARMTGARRIVEIGTHFGGAARAFAEGQRAAGLDADVLTFDVDDRAGDPIAGFAGVERVLADVRSEEGAARLREWAAGEPIDIVYIDALKDGEFITSTAAALADLDIGWLVFDDIFANRNIRAGWESLGAAHGDRAITVDDVALGIRFGGFGQGVIAVGGDVLDALDDRAEILARLREDARGQWSPALPETPQAPAKLAPEGPRERPAERTLLREAVARCEGRGEIVVLGAASGTTATTLAAALAERPGPCQVSVNVIASFLTTSATVSKVREDPVTPRREPFLADFRDRLGPHGRYVNLIAGDVPSLRWSSRPIELLVLGWHRDEAELAHAFTELLPHCIPGGSLVIVEDFGYESAPYLHASLGRLLDHFDIVGFVPNALALAPISTPDASLLREVAEGKVEESTRYVDRLDEALTDRLAKVLVERGRTLLRRRMGLQDPMPAPRARADVASYAGQAPTE